jgi:hypothetical protein
LIPLRLTHTKIKFKKKGHNAKDVNVNKNDLLKIIISMGSKGNDEFPSREGVQGETVGFPLKEGFSI